MAKDLINQRVKVGRNFKLAIFNSTHKNVSKHALSQDKRGSMIPSLYPICLVGKVQVAFIVEIFLVALLWTVSSVSDVVPQDMMRPCAL